VAKKDNKTYDEKFEELWDINTGHVYSEKKQKQMSEPTSEATPVPTSDISDPGELTFKRKESLDHRIPVRISQQQNKNLEVLAENSGRSKAEILRMSLDFFIKMLLDQEKNS